MKRTILVIYLTFLAISCFSQRFGYHNYTGYIDGKYAITLELTVSADNRYAYYTGSYYYNSVGKRLQLKGGYDSQGMNGANPDADDYIYEYSDGKNTGVFIFSRNQIGNTTLNGFWENPQGKRMRVSLRKVR